MRWGLCFTRRVCEIFSVEAAREICSNLPERVEKVGVFVGEAGSQLERVVLAAGLTAVQQYLPLESDARSRPAMATGQDVFRKRTKFFHALPIAPFLEAGAPVEELAKAFAHLRDGVAGSVATPDGVIDAFFFDSGGMQSPGGTGRTFDWERAAPITEGMRRGGVKLVVAGGLTPENVGAAIGILKPWGVDVVSGVEARPGKKDPEKVRAFVRAVRDAERSL